MTVLVAHQGELPALEPGLVERWLYVGDDTAWRVAAERGALSGIPRISIGAEMQAAAARLRRPYIDWIGALSAANDSTAWWSSELAAKNSYTMLFSNVCALAAARAHLSDGVLAVCSSPALAAELLEEPGAQRRGAAAPSAPASSGSAGRRALRAWARLAPSPLLGFPGVVSDRLRTSLDNDPRYRLRVLGTQGAHLPDFAGDDTVLAFTWVDRRSFPEGGGYVDPHLGALPAQLRARGLRVAYVPRVLHGMPFSEAVSRLRSSGETIVFPDLLLDLDDWRACAREANAFAPRIPDDATVEGVPIRRLALETVERYRSAQAVALSYDRIVANLASHGVSPALVVHTYEGHSWELALIRAARKHWPDAQVAGYENLNMSRFALSMYPARSELELRPMPDRIVTNGPAYAQVLVEEGVPEERVRVGCALRHADLWQRPPHVDRAARDAFRVLVATDGTLGHAAELVEKASAALGGDERYAVTVKCHPLVPEERVRSMLSGALTHDNVSFSSAPIAELLTLADVLLYTHSVVCYEALAQGVPPVFVQSENVVDLDQLEPFPELRLEARTPDEIRLAVAQHTALSNDELSAWRIEARAAAASALAPVSAACTDAFTGAE